MNELQIKGASSLNGEIVVQGSKNSILPILAASVLIPGVSSIENCPCISDVEDMIELLRHVGCLVYREGHCVTIDATHITGSRLPLEITGKMRSSILMMGALVARCREVTLGAPGGCMIGERPIDIHLSVLGRLGVSFEQRKEYLTAYTENLVGSFVSLRFPSVGATENGILSAVFATGRTVIHNCATEPEIQALCSFLNKAGAKITGVGTSRIQIDGVKELNEISFKLNSDRIVAGTYLLSTVALGGRVTLYDAPICEMKSVIDVARRMGAEVVIEQDHVLRIIQEKTAKSIPYLATGIYPGFPTDLQSILMTAFTQSEGESILEETIFENRFHIKYELEQMGADIVSNEGIALIRGPKKLRGKHIYAKDLRGGAALVLAGICADGATILKNCHLIERGYEDICRDYRLLGVDMKIIR